MFRQVSSRVNFPEMETGILQFWKDFDIFHKTEEGDMSEKPLFMLYEGPPTANGSPGIHHVLARVFKDIICRYKTMKGYRCLRKGGWDTHGLPVELEVERELGLKSKRDIEEYGIEEFNQRCRESVFRYVREWESMTDRIGFWVDMEHPYVTLENDYIETGWWILRQLWDKGLLYKDIKGTPHCPRCVTSLSSHEEALGYQENTPDPSVYIKFRVESLTLLSSRHPPESPLAKGGFRGVRRGTEDEGNIPTYFLAWTTTPWTLPGNTALAVAPDADYSIIEIEGENGLERLIMASALVESTIKEPHRVVDTVKGSSLVGLTYESLYDPGAFGVDIRCFQTGDVPGVGRVTTLEVTHDFTPRVVGTDFVSLEDGTGIVHIAPAFGDEDLGAGREYGLAFVQPVDLQGMVTGNYPFAGKFVKEADEDIIADLKERDLLYQVGVYRHTYPFCWRCDTPLLYYAKPSWYIRTTAAKERLISANREINWYPEYIKEGRFGEWLRNNVDWAISRERYWGTPIPLWLCGSCGDYHCIGSVAELKEMVIPEHKPLVDNPSAGSGQALDLHRPYVDQIAIRCPHCGANMMRIPEVMDAWFDSGAMPYAQYHVTSPDDVKRMQDDGRLPADYICEAVDQTRGWFYTLHALSTLLMDQPSYRNVICLGLILDGQGQKMSKHLGNVVDPWTVLDAQGADAIRWYLFTAAQPGESRRFSQDLVNEVVRRFLLTLWNVYSFFTTYASVDQFHPDQVPQDWKPTSELDRWLLSELNSLVSQVDRHLEGYNPTDAGRRIQDFVDRLSNWYVRRSRRRFWKSENDEDKISAYATLYTCLTTLCKLLAPFMPFVAEEMYQNLVRSVAQGHDNEVPESVHLASFPQASPDLIDESLMDATRLAMRISSMGRGARSKAGVKVRQPLSSIKVLLRSDIEKNSLVPMITQIIDEINVKSVAIAAAGGAEDNDFWEWKVSPNLAKIGPKYGTVTQLIATALANLDPRGIALAIDVDGWVQVPIPDETISAVQLGYEDVTVIKTAKKSGHVEVQDGPYAVAVDITVTPELLEEGLARELVHRIQNLRRTGGFEITDRILTFYQGSHQVQDVMQKFADYIQQETLSEELIEREPEEGAHTEKQKLEGMDVVLGVKKVHEGGA